MTFTLEHVCSKLRLSFGRILIVAYVICYCDPTRPYPKTSNLQRHPHSKTQNHHDSEGAAAAMVSSMH